MNPDADGRQTNLILREYMKYLKLFEPCILGRIELANRLLMPPITTNYAKDGFVTDRLIDFYTERARGGIGLIIVEDSIIETPRGKHAANDIFISDNKYIPNLQRLAQAIKNQGAKAGIHLNHSGRNAGRLRNGRLFLTNGQIPVAPSAVAYPYTSNVVPHELDVEEIQEIEDKFADAASRAQEANFDIIMLHCSHGYLIEQFLSPFSNKRQDEYGGDLERRFRFLLEIIVKIKKKIGDNFPLLCRISGEELWEGGLSFEDARQNAQRLQTCGIHGVSVSVGAGLAGFPYSYFAPVGATPMRGRRGATVHLAAGIKDVLSIPVIASNRLNTPALAEQILEQGKADLIGIGRGLIADPEWAKKVQEGRESEIRHCICCNYCFMGGSGAPLVCAINPVAGREQKFKITSASKSKNVLIAGAGPAGLEAARIASLRGHKVHIYEKDKPGGQLNLASIPLGKETIRQFIEYEMGQLNSLGVKIVYKELDLEIIHNEKPDAVIIATGACPIEVEIRGSKNKNVISAWEGLCGVVPRGRIVVIGGGQIGAETAEVLATHGNEVTIVEESDKIAGDTFHLIWFYEFLLLSLRILGIKMLTKTKVEEITENGVIVNYNGQRLTLEADTVILALGTKSNQSLARQLELAKLNIELYKIGDCAGVGKIVKAIKEGFNAGLTL